MNIKKFFEIAEDEYRINMRGRTENVAMCYIIKDKKVDRYVFTSQDRSPMDYLKPLIMEYDPDAYLFCSEAWYVSGKKSDMDKLKDYTYGDIAKDPNKKEAIIIFGGDKTNKNRVHKVLSIKRDKTNKIISIRAVKIKKAKVESSKLP